VEFVTGPLKVAENCGVVYGVVCAPSAEPSINRIAPNDMPFIFMRLLPPEIVKFTIPAILSEAA
jgi:hypothetical protein